MKPPPRPLEELPGAPPVPPLPPPLVDEDELDEVVNVLVSLTAAQPSARAAPTTAAVSRDRVT
jgi:hypothetical protein